MDFDALSANAIEAITVSPAPVTSNTSKATVGNVFTSSSKIAIPSSESVIIEISKSQVVFKIVSASFKEASSLIAIPVASDASFLFGVSSEAPLYLE